MLTKTLLLATTLVAQVSFAQSWEVNDVSYLFPLKMEQDSLLKVTSSGERGELIPQRVLKNIDRLVMSYDAPKDEVTSLRAMGMRIDPCFKYVATSTKCSPQLRLVWQPTDNLQSQAKTYDAAIHAFYDLSETEFKELTTQLKLLKLKNASASVLTDKLPLGVHPGFTNPKTKNYFLTDLKKVILRFAGEKNLARLTFMRLLTPMIWWEFGGFDKSKNGEWARFNIPRHPTDEIKQDFFNDDFNVQVAMKGTIIPHRDYMGYPDDFSDVIHGYSIYPETAEGKKLINKSLVTINKIENPKIHSPATMDCVHCHIAEPLQIWLNDKYKARATTESAYIQEFKGKHNLSNTTRKNDHNKSLRAFGYFGELPSINQRVINESAEIADELNRRKL